MSLRTPLELAFGDYMGRFYAQLVADTPSMVEYVARGLSKSIVWAPGRMIDSVEDMLAEWRKNENQPGPGASAMLPVMICAMSKDFNPSMVDWGVALRSPVDITSPDDPYARAFRVRTSANDYRVQIAIIAAEPHSAHSLAMQLHLWANDMSERRFTARYMQGDIAHDFPAVLEEIDLGAMDAKAEQKNLTILTADISLRATVPIFQAPGKGEANDGKPAPAGYPVVLEVDAFTPISPNNMRSSRSIVDVDSGQITTEWTS